MSSIYNESCRKEVLSMTARTHLEKEKGESTNDSSFGKSRRHSSSSEPLFNSMEECRKDDCDALAQSVPRAIVSNEGRFLMEHIE